MLLFRRMQAEIGHQPGNADRCFRRQACRDSEAETGYTANRLDHLPLAAPWHASCFLHFPRLVHTKHFLHVARRGTRRAILITSLVTPEISISY